MNLTEKRQLGVEMIQRIEQLSRPKKWQVTREFLLSQNENARLIDQKFCEQLRAERLRLHNEVTGSSKTGDSQYLLSMPDFIFTSLIALDPTLNDELNDKDKNYSTRMWKKLAKAFPMYKIPREVS